MADSGDTAGKGTKQVLVTLRALEDETDTIQMTVDVPVGGPMGYLQSAVLVERIRIGDNVHCAMADWHDV